MTATERTELVAVDTVITGEWIITLNAAREIYRDGPGPAPGRGTSAVPGGRQNPMASRSSKTVPRPGWGSALRMSRRLMALGCP